MKLLSTTSTQKRRYYLVFTIHIYLYKNRISSFCINYWKWSKTFENCYMLIQYTANSRRTFKVFYINIFWFITIFHFFSLVFLCALENYWKNRKITSFSQYLEWRKLDGKVIYFCVNRVNYLIIFRRKRPRKIGKSSFWAMSQKTVELYILLGII